MITFEITYLVHKRRSVNFCGIQFDEGRRIKTTIKSWLLRNFVGIVAGCLAAIGVCVNFDLVQVRHIDPDAGNTSWLDLFDNPRTADTSLHRVRSCGDSNASRMLSFYFPTTHTTAKKCFQ